MLRNKDITYQQKTAFLSLYEKFFNEQELIIKNYLLIKDYHSVVN